MYVVSYSRCGWGEESISVPLCLGCLLGSHCSWGKGLVEPCPKTFQNLQLRLPGFKIITIVGWVFFFSLPSVFLIFFSVCRIIEYPKLEGTHRDHQVQLLESSFIFPSFFFFLLKLWGFPQKNNSTFSGGVKESLNTTWFTENKTKQKTPPHKNDHLILQGEVCRVETHVGSAWLGEALVHSGPANVLGSSPGKPSTWGRFHTFPRSRGFGHHYHSSLRCLEALWWAPVISVFLLPFIPIKYLSLNISPHVGLEAFEDGVCVCSMFTVPSFCIMVLVYFIISIYFQAKCL